MKTYCKPKDVCIDSAKFNLRAVYAAYDNGKLKKNDFRRLLASTGKIEPAQLREDVRNCDWTRINPAIESLATILTARINNRQLDLEPLRQFQRRDRSSGKLRDLCRESPEQQIFEYINVYALMPLYKAKLLSSQYGSIPGKGQVRGKRHIEKILRRKRKGKLYCIKIDVQKAYPSTKTELVMKLLRRDIAKNDTLLWFSEAVMENYPNGTLCIGGYLSTWHFNYVMSYLLRHIWSLGRNRRGKFKRYVWDIVSYADDTAVFGTHSGLKKALKETARWAESELGLHIKDYWQIVRVSDFDDEKRNHADRSNGSRKRMPGIDMMGYVVRRCCTIIRGRVFVHARRQMLRAWKNLRTLGRIPFWRAQKLISYGGYFKHTDSTFVKEKYHIDEIIRAAKISIGQYKRRLYYGKLYNETVRRADVSC